MSTNVVMTEMLSSCKQLITIIRHCCSGYGPLCFFPQSSHWNLVKDISLPEKVLDAVPLF